MYTVFIPTGKAPDDHTYDGFPMDTKRIWFVYGDLAEARRRVKEESNRYGYPNVFVLIPPADDRNLCIVQGRAEVGGHHITILKLDEMIKHGYITTADVVEAAPRLFACYPVVLQNEGLFAALDHVD